MFALYGKLYSILKRSFSFSGRSPRKDFWFFFVVYALLYFAALGADVSYYRMTEPTGIFLTLQTLFGGREPFVWLHLILLSPAMLAVMIRRLHDRGRSGWWSLVYLVPLLGLVPMVAMLARKGQDGFNRFGANPLSVAQIEAADRLSQRPNGDAPAASGQYAAAE
ncbi:Uncharacterized membrane protein YhaH, DUF805 family [Cohaesibacter sp. ES.047]|uniref:DUF805 domain-containing protein n=1 Tax=Cohaesibacter sp. ES.047 TaxID=1798205 RepID=UPI000BB7D193|nr:DUF805 domain-containing protein [Cohaesibacter sp. ES.047]SNY92565.1 Uncharacterized membrane protein YhaH, DUF805 family [Cohaesibacter sp. ES.047]